MSIEKANEIYNKLFDNIKTIIKGKDDIIKKLLAAFFSGGHVLLEDYPGTGKTSLAKTLAKSINSDFKRIQFTPDLLPSDILGVSIFNQREENFEFKKGPIFTNILLSDEINRASPRTQSALLEAMAESQISTEGKEWKLDDLFFVIATQNPVESHGTYPLPEAQMDRFMIKLSLGYVSTEEEVNILNSQIKNNPIKDIKQVVSKEEILFLRDYIKNIKISNELLHYIVNIVSASRNSEHILLGASSRASISLLRMAQAFAMIQGMDFVIPEHIQLLAKDVLCHRLMIDPQSKFNGISAENLVQKIIEGIKVPV